MAAVTRLIEALTSSDPSMRADAAEKLAALGADAREAVPALIRALEDKSFSVQLWAMRALGAIGSGAAAALDKIKEIAARSKTDELVEAAAMAMYRIEGTAKQATIFLQALLTMGRDANARMRAAADLGLIGETPAIPALIRGLEDTTAGVRREAAQALGKLGPAAKSAIPLLERLLADQRDDSARIAAAEALWRIDKKVSGISYLCTLLRQTGTDGAIRVKAARAIGEMRERAKPALPVLVEALDDPSEELRSAIADALLKIQPGFS